MKMLAAVLFILAGPATATVWTFHGDCAPEQTCSAVDAQFAMAPSYQGGTEESCFLVPPGNLQTCKQIESVSWTVSYFSFPAQTYTITNSLFGLMGHLILPAVSGGAARINLCFAFCSERIAYIPSDDRWSFYSGGPGTSSVVTPHGSTGLWTVHQAPEPATLALLALGLLVLLGLRRA